MNGNEPLIQQMPSGNSFLRTTFDFSIGETNLRPEYWQAIVIIFLLFLIIMSIARWRHLYVKWNLQGFVPSVLLGFILTLLLEGLLLVGGRTLLTEILGWKNAPKPISTALDEGKARLVTVLGVQDEVPDAAAQSTADEIINNYKILDKKDAEYVQSAICKLLPDDK